MGPDRKNEPDDRVDSAGGALSKKAKILGLHAAGVHDIDKLAARTGAKKSYVASVLRASGRLDGYFDLYTHTTDSMNVYSREFAGKLRFKDVPTARASVAFLMERYQHYAEARDRAGQHHCLVMALTMFHRARWTGKRLEADVYRRWLLDRLVESAADEISGMSPAPH